MLIKTSQYLQLLVTFAQNLKLWACPRVYVKYNVFVSLTSAESRDLPGVYYESSAVLEISQEKTPRFTNLNRTRLR